MLSYGIFKDMLVDQIKEYMPKEYQIYPLEVRKYEKANIVVDGLSFGIPGPTPCIRINDAYETYRECESMETVLKSVAVQMVEEYEKVCKMGNIIDNAVKENVLMKLINTNMNQELLAHCPHREVMDLSVVYYWVFAMDEEGMATALITNENVGKIHATEEELFELATQNAKRLMPTTVHELGAFLGLFISDFPLGEDFASVKSDYEMLVVSNEQGVNGAVTMLDDEVLHTIAEHFGNNLHILPSSIHEIIVIKAEEGHEKELSEMVADINQKEVSLGDRLSDNVYFYDRLKRELTMATGSPEINRSKASQQEDREPAKMLIAHSRR